MTPTSVHRSVLGCLVVVLCTVPTIAQQITALSEYLTALHHQHRFTGYVSVARIQWYPQDGSVTGSLLLHNTGVGSPAADGPVPFTDTTRFQIGSVTKPFIANTVRGLIDQGLLDAESTIDQWFPHFPNADRITVQHLLDHRAGLADYKDIPNWEEYAAGVPTPQETIRLMAEQVPIRSEPGASFRYSNVGYIMLGVILERVVGASARYVVNTWVQRQLQLYATGIPADRPDLNLPFTSGNMYSTPRNLLEFIEHLVRDGSLPDSAGAASWIAARAPYKDGWGMRDYNGVPGVGHYGAMQQYVCSITWLPTHDLAVVLCGYDEHIPYRTMTEDIVTGLVTGVYPPVIDETPRTVTTTELRAAPGTYRLPSGSELTVVDRDGHLMLQESGQEALSMHPIAGDRFSFTQLERFARFEGHKGVLYQILVLEDLHGTPVLRARRTD